MQSLDETLQDFWLSLTFCRTPELDSALYPLVLILGLELAGFRPVHMPPKSTNRALSMLLCNPLQCWSIDHVSAQLIPCIIDILMQLLIRLVEQHRF